MQSAAYELSTSSRLIRQRLRTVGVDETVTDAELSDLVGKPVYAGMPALNSALNYMLREHLFVFSRVRKVGYTRLRDGNIVNASDRHIRGIRKKAKRAARELAAADYVKLTPQEQLSATAKQTVFGMIHSLATDDGMKNVVNGGAFRPGALDLRGLAAGAREAMK